MKMLRIILVVAVSCSAFVLCNVVPNIDTNDINDNTVSEPLLPGRLTYCSFLNKIYTNDPELFEDLSFSCKERVGINANNYIEQRTRYPTYVYGSSGKHGVRQFFTLMRHYLICKDKRMLPSEVNCTLINGLVSSVSSKFPETLKIECADEVVNDKTMVAVSAKFFMRDVFQQDVIDTFYALPDYPDFESELVQNTTEALREERDANPEGKLPEHFEYCMD